MLRSKSITSKQKTDFVSTERERRIYSFLSSHPIGVLSSIDSIHGPHGAVIYFAINRRFEISFITKVDTQKYRNLKQSSRVMLTVFEPESQTVSQITGHATEVKEPLFINEIADASFRASLLTSPDGIPPITKLQAGSYAAFAIAPSQIRMAIYSRPEQGGYNDAFESIESYDLELVSDNSLYNS